MYDDRHDAYFVEIPTEPGGCEPSGATLYVRQSEGALLLTLRVGRLKSQQIAIPLSVAGRVVRLMEIAMGDAHEEFLEQRERDRLRRETSGDAPPAPTTSAAERPAG